MTAKKSVGVKRMHVELQPRLHDMLKRFAAQQNLSMREIIEKYLEYLFAQDYGNRMVLDATSDEIPDLKFKNIRPNKRIS